MTMARKIYEINEFARSCGYFFNAYIDQDFCSNNGYNCRHPQQEETNTNEHTGEEIGSCFAWCCPLAYEADEEDFNNPNIDNNGYDTWEEGSFVIPLQKGEANLSPHTS